MDAAPPTPGGVAAPRRWRDPALLAYAVAVLVGAGQVAAGLTGVVPFADGPAVIAAATVPYLAGLAVLVVLRQPAGPRWRHDLEVWTVGLTMAGVLLAAWAVVRFAVALPDAIGAEYGFYRLKGSITSPFGDHNTLAGLLLPPLVASAVLASRRLRWGAATAMIALGLVATLSRGAAVVMLVVVAAAVATASNRRVTATLAGGALAVAVGLGAAGLALDTSVPPGTAPPGPATQAGAGPLGASVLGRVDLAVRGVEVGLEHPVAGIGLGRFASVADDLPQPNDHAHQGVAHAFAEGGLPLLLATLAIVAVLGVRAVRLPRSPRRDLVLLGGLGLVAHAQVEILSGRLGYEVLLAALVGLAATGVRPPGASLRGSGPRPVGSP